MYRIIATLSIFLLCNILFAQTWQAVGSGTNNSSHGMLVYDGKLVDLGSFNNPCKRVALWNGTSWECLGNGVGIVARAGVVWNGNLVVVGDFWNVFQPCTNCNGIAMWDGTQWTNIGAGFNNDVLCVTVWNGDLVAAGDFTQSNGQPCSRIARWTGTTWEQIGPNNAFNNDIRAITEFDGELWVGGDFSNVGGCTSCDGLVKWNGSSWVGGNSGVDLSGGVDTTVRVLYVSPTDGRLYMGGHFRGLTPNGVYNADLNGVAVYDGSDWFALDQGVGDNPDDYVRAISEYNGQIVAGGYFTTASGISANKIARFNLTTETWSNMGLGFNGVGVDEYVKSAAVWNGIFFAGGAYTIAESNPMNYIAQWYEPPVAAPIATINQEQFSVCSGSCASFNDISTYNPTSWNWSFPGGSITSSTLQNPPPICYSTPGTYTVTLQACNNAGCNTTTATIDVISSSSVTVNNPTICAGSNAVLTADPSVTGGTFLWSPGGQTTSSITVSPLSTTTYTVTYTSSSCGTASATSTVTVNSSAPTVTVNNPTICEGSSVTLTATPSASGGTYTWYPGGETTSSITVNPTSSSIYTVTYSLGGCSSSPTNSSVTVNPVPALTSTSETICNGESIVLSATPSLAGGSFLWSPGGETTSQITVNPTSTATYTVSYTLDGCTSPVSSSMVTVNPIPTVSVSDQTLCMGGSATLSAVPSSTGGSFLWSPGGETTSSITVSPVSDASYSVIYTLNGCQSISESALVSVISPPTVSVNSDDICSGETATLTAVPSVSGGTYLWSPGGQTSASASFSPTSTANYQISYTIPGCPPSVATGTVTVTPTPTVSTNSPVICSGESAVIMATPSEPGGTYLWTPGNETTSQIVLTPGSSTSCSVIYTLNGCSSPAATSAITVNPMPDLTTNTSNNTITASQISANYLWLDCNNSFAAITGETSQSFTPVNNGSYAAQIALNGCIDTTECVLISTIGISETAAGIPFSVRPNPAEDKVIIVSDMAYFRVIITDGYGKIVYVQSVSGPEIELNIQSLSPGIYSIQVEGYPDMHTRFLKL